MRDVPAGMAARIRRLLAKLAPGGVSSATMGSLIELLSLHPNAFSGRRPRVAKSLPKQRVLVLSPHPDDEVIGMGGTLGLYIENGSDVTVVYLTDGGGLGENRRELVGVRRKEAEALASRYVFRQIFWDVEDTRLTNEPGLVSDLVAVIEELRPSVIYLPSFFEHHFDHYAANAVLRDALERYPSAKPDVAGYEVWDSIAFPNFCVDVSDSIETKKAMMMTYATPLQYTDFVKLFLHRSALHYLLRIDSARAAFEGHAEAFHRLDARSYCAQFDAYQRILESQDSPLAKRLRKPA